MEATLTTNLVEPICVEHNILKLHNYYYDTTFFS